MIKKEISKNSKRQYSVFIVLHIVAHKMKNFDYWLLLFNKYILVFAESGFYNSNTDKHLNNQESKYAQISHAKKFFLFSNDRIL